MLASGFVLEYDRSTTHGHVSKVNMRVFFLPSRNSSVKYGCCPSTSTHLKWRGIGNPHWFIPDLTARATTTWLAL